MVESRDSTGMTEPTPHGLQVVVKDMDSFVASVQKLKKFGKIGSILLSGSTAKGVDCEAWINDGNNDIFYLRANIYLRFEEGGVFNRIGKDPSFKMKGNNLIITGDNGTSFVLRPIFYKDSAEQNHLRLTNGWGWNIGSNKSIQIEPFPTKTPDGIIRATQDFCQILQRVIGIIDKDKQTSNETLILQAPSEEEQEELGDLKGTVSVETPNVTFEEIGGQREAREEIETFSFALTNPDSYKKWGTKPPKGILIYGPPGTGKTLLAKALATQAHAKFIHVKASDIGTMWFGESEKNMQRIFDAANLQLGKTIIFFDEIDALTPSRKSLDAGSGGTQATIRILSTLMENLDGLSSHPNVFVVGATNRRESIDGALLRPGRFDRMVEVPLPDADGRVEIFQIHMGKAKAFAERELFENIDMDALLARSDQYSGADIAEIIRRTLESKLKLEMAGENPSLVTTEDLLAQMLPYEVERQVKNT